MDNDSNLKKTKKLTLLSQLFAAAIVLSFIEGAFPPIPFFPPGVKLGLANVVVMYSLFFLGKKEAFIITSLKAMFVFLIRGGTAGILSFSGSLLSFLIIFILMAILKENASYTLLSVLGAVFHNMGQFLAISLIFGSFVLAAYLPVLIIMGILAGIATATVLKYILPAFERLKRAKLL